MVPSRDAAELLRRFRLRVTPQRRSILEAFHGPADEHLSAEEVLSRASMAVPEISRGTVYAALAELTELGLLSSVGHVEPVRYEINLKPHDHFHCRLCMRIFDVDLGGTELLSRPPEGYSVESVAVRAEGICVACREYRRGLSDGARAIKEHPTIDADAIGDFTCAVVDSPVGELAFAASDDGIARVAFTDHADFGVIARCAARRGVAGARSRLRLLDVALGQYLAGSHAALIDDVDWRLTGPATAETLRRVWEIPFGEFRSYQDMCSHLSAYSCGLAMGTNPIPLLIPCHRVSCGTCRPEIYVGGVERLHFLRDLEAGPGARRGA